MRDVQLVVNRGWVAHYGAAGDLHWQRVLDLGLGEEASVLWDVVAFPDGSACALAHDFLSDNNGSVRCFSRDGEPTLERKLAIPRCRRAVAMADGSLVAGGSKLLEWSDGWAHAAAWVGRIDGARLIWEGTRVGEFSSRSDVVCLARTAAGEVITGGRIGRRDGGPASQPWLAKWDGHGKLLWSKTLPLYAWRDQEVRAVAVTGHGDVFAAGFSGSAWVQRYDAQGQLLAEHRWPATEHIASLHATDDGYVAYGATSQNPWDPAHGPFKASWVRAYSNAGELRWASIEREAVFEIGSLQPGRTGELLALRMRRLRECPPGSTLMRVADKLSCLEAVVVAYRPP